MFSADLNTVLTRQSSTRAGRYIKQPNGYRAFVPSPLPPDPRIELDDALLDALSKADRAVARLDGCAEMLPNSELFLFMYIRKEAVLSSQIEGTQASLMDVLEFEAAAKQAVSKDVGDVFNYLNAMNYGLTRLKTFPLSLRLIREIHGKLLTGVRSSEGAGEFRTGQNWIGSRGSVPIFIPPPPHEMKTALHNFEQFLHDDAPMPFLIRAGIAHAQFETIHPFVDGNGRLGRLLVTFMLCERKLLTKPLLYLSYFLKKHRDEYFSHLQAVRESGKWEQWLLFFLRGVAEVAEEATTTARKIVQLREYHRKLIVDARGRSTSRGLTLLENLYKQPVVSMSNITEMFDITFQGASDMARQFLSLRILEEITGRRRNRLFAYSRYLKLLGERIHQRGNRVSEHQRRTLVPPPQTFSHTHMTVAK